MNPQKVRARLAAALPKTGEALPQGPGGQVSRVSTLVLDRLTPVVVFLLHRERTRTLAQLARDGRLHPKHGGCPWCEGFLAGRRDAVSSDLQSTVVLREQVRHRAESLEVVKINGRWSGSGKLLADWLLS